MNYAIADGWTKLNGTNIPANVYYREVSAEDAKNGVSYNVLAGDTTYPNGVVTVSENLTKDEIKNITAQPKLTFTAYAVQKDGSDTAADAWAKVTA